MKRSASKASSGRKTGQLVIRVSESMRTDLEELAASRDEKLAVVVRDIIRRGLASIK